MLQLNLTTTRTRSLPPPQPLPEVTEPPRSAFLAGWWGGICCGSVIGMGSMLLLLKALGRVVA
ncbi:MAG: hypothetical protein ACK40L_08555 [Hydrogenophaga sp.]